jgi:hypothetical protein
MSRMLALIVLAGLAGACAGPGPGVTGNYTGGIIPWSPANEHSAFLLSDAHCARYAKVAQVTSVYRQPGHYIAFACLFPRGYIVRDRQVVVRSRG